MGFGTDQVLLYNVEPWNLLGFGVPAFGGSNVGTLNRALHGLADEIGRLQLYIMTHVDATRIQPPSRNTVERLGKMINRVQTVLAARSREYNELRLEEGHVRPARYIWTVHPVPYFRGNLVRNKWLAEFNDLCMFGLSNIYQHSDNNLALTVTAALAQQVWQYFRELKLQLGTELLRIPEETLVPDAFRFAAEHYAAYKPEEVTINVESLDTPGDIWALPTELDLFPLFQGIPAVTILPMLAQYPVGPVKGATGITGLPISDETAASGTASGKSIGPVVM